MCQLPLRGQDVQGLRAALGVDVAASTDATGAAAQGGDWVLEYQLGEIAAGVIIGPSVLGLVDLTGDRCLMLQHRVMDGVLLEDEDTTRVLQHLADLWGYPVLLREVDDRDEDLLDEHAAEPRRPFGSRG
jgi:hypothetical protein